MKRIFIDGAHGTVGRHLKGQLHASGLGVKLIEIAEDFRKDERARAKAMSDADLVVVCVPDSAASDAVALIRRVNPFARILDTSAAHRTDPAWLYGLAEISSSEALRSAPYVANPGCFATGCILLGLAIRGGDRDPRAVFHGVTGYSAAGNNGHRYAMPMLTQFGTSHRHLPEIQKYAGVVPVLTTMVGPWEQGMLVQTHINQGLNETMERLVMLYQHHPDIEICQAAQGIHKLDVTACNGTNKVKILVAGQPAGGVSLACCFDNLGKGSAGAALVNIKEMLKIG